jgi:hypothetical protein
MSAESYFNRKDTTIGIWDIRYHVTYNFLNSRSINDIKVRGVRVTGIKRFDNEVKHEVVRAWLTINEMVGTLFCLTKQKPFTYLESSVNRSDGM